MSGEMSGVSSSMPSHQHLDIGEATLRNELPDPVPTTMPTYFRTLSQNELSYFLPSRAYGLNDMFMLLTFHAPPGLISPLRLHLAWAIMRLRHTLLACQIEMEPGHYDEARFKYTPPASPDQAVKEAGDTLRIYDDRTGPELVEAFIDPAAPRKLSSKRIARLDVAKHGRVSPGFEEYQMMVMMIHAVNDGLAVHRHGNMILELLGGSATPGGHARTDAELAHLLDMEWKTRWGRPRVGEVIVPATEDRLPSPSSKFQESAWKVDYLNVEKRAMGGHVFPRIPSRATKHVLARTQFDVRETAALLAKCKEQRVTLPNVMFALCNLAWIRTADNHPEFAASKTLPMMMYTALSLRRYLTPSSPLSSYMSLALGYCNVILPSFLPPSVDPSAMFWLRARSAQSQMRNITHSPLLFGRSQIMSVARGQRAKAFAKQDDEADGTLPRSAEKPPQPPLPPRPGPASIPSAVLVGISCLGDVDEINRTTRYPDIQVVDGIGHVRKAKGGILLVTSSINKRFSVVLGWDSLAFAPGVIEEFWGHFVSGAREFLLDSHSHTSSKL
ncbi:hypothetical protein FB451DRAFT_755779 [Mycena latifolia]|nr:hypothetical protein FB451DRAFT_755779 [Mycena latifolia]